MYKIIFHNIKRSYCKFSKKKNSKSSLIQFQNTFKLNVKFYDKKLQSKFLVVTDNGYRVYFSISVSVHYNIIILYSSNNNTYNIMRMVHINTHIEFITLQ